VAPVDSFPCDDVLYQMHRVRGRREVKESDRTPEARIFATMVHLPRRKEKMTQCGLVGIHFERCRSYAGTVPVQYRTDSTSNRCIIEKRASIDPVVFSDNYALFSPEYIIMFGK